MLTTIKHAIISKYIAIRGVVGNHPLCRPDPCGNSIITFRVSIAISAVIAFLKIIRTMTNMYSIISRLIHTHTLKQHNIQHTTTKLVAIITTQSTCISISIFVSHKPIRTSQLRFQYTHFLFFSKPLSSSLHYTTGSAPFSYYCLALILGTHKFLITCLHSYFIYSVISPTYRTISLL